jgi:hypothetical protein
MQCLQMLSSPVHDSCQVIVACSTDVHAGALLRHENACIHTFSSHEWSDCSCRIAYALQTQADSLRKGIAYLAALPGMSDLTEQTVLGSLQAFLNNEQVRSVTARRQITDRFCCEEGTIPRTATTVRGPLSERVHPVAVPAHAATLQPAWLTHACCLSIPPP